MLDDIFSNLNLEKEMLFDDDRKLTFGQALLDLQKKLGIKKKDIDTLALSEKISTMLAEVGKNLYNDKFAISSASNFAIFCGWVMSIHNTHLVPHQGQAFPNNIFFDILQSVRSNFNDDEAELYEIDYVFRFMLEGLNARKIKKGEVPNTPFIASSLALSVITAMEAEQKSIFYQTYAKILDFTKLQTSLENAYTELNSGDSKNTFSILTTTKTSSGHAVLDLDGANRTSSGACIYDSESVIKLAQELPLDASKLESLALSAIKILTDFDKDFQQIEANEETKDLAMWDASDWIWRLYLIVCIAGQKESITGLNTISVIVKKCETGDFNANQREECLQKDNITKLFQQFHLSSEELQDAYEKAKESSPLAKSRTALHDDVTKSISEKELGAEASTYNSNI